MSLASADRELTWREKNLIRRQSPLNHLIGFALAFGAAGQYLWVMLKASNASVGWMIQMVILSIVLGMLSYGLWMWRFRLHHRIDMNLMMLALGGLGMMVGTVVDNQLGIGHGAHGHHGMHGGGHAQHMAQPVNTAQEGQACGCGMPVGECSCAKAGLSCSCAPENLLKPWQPAATQSSTQPHHVMAQHEHSDHSHGHEGHSSHEEHHESKRQDHAHHDHHDHSNHDEHAEQSHHGHHGHGGHKMGMLDYFISHSYSFHVWMMLVFSVPPTVLFTRCGVRASMNKGEWLTVHVIGNATMIIGMIFFGWLATLFAHETGVWTKTINHSMMMIGMFLGMNLGMMAGFVLVPKAIREKLDQVGRAG